MWNPGQKQFLGGAFIPENQPPKQFGQIALPCTFCYQGDAYRKCKLDKAFRLDSMDLIEFTGDELVYPQTNLKPTWQDAFGARSWG